MERLEIEQQVRAHLGRNERLLWSGRPKQGILFRRSDAFVIPFSLVWLGLVVSISATSYDDSDVDLFGKGFDVLFVLVGLHFLIGRFFTDALARKKMVYGITNERAVIIGGLFTQFVKSVVLRTLTEVELTEHKDGTGTIKLGPRERRGRGYAEPPMFEGIDNPRAVYEQLRQAQSTVV